MNTRALGIFLFVDLLIVIGIVVYFMNKESIEDVPIATDPIQVESKPGIAEALQPRVADELSAAEARIRELEAKALDDAALVEELQASAAEAELAAEESLEDEPEEDGEKLRTVSLDDIRAKLEASPQASAQIKALTEMLYADFLNGIELDTETKAELRTLLTDSFMEEMALSRYAMKDGEIPWSEVTEWGNDEKTYLSDQLKGLLSDDDYSAWNDYTSNIEERMLETTLRNQIRAFASGLSPENFETVMQVAVEEFRAEQIALENSNTLFTQSENIYYQIRAMAAMRDRLSGYLSEDQYAEISNWLTMAENMMNASLPQETEGQ